MDAILNHFLVSLAFVGLLFPHGVAPQLQIFDSSVYYDDFEQYKSDGDIKKAYTVWKDGAQLDVSLSKTPLDPSVHSLRLNFGRPDQSDKTIRVDVVVDGQTDQALKVTLLAPNSSNKAINGSIYHVLPGRGRVWTGGTAIRFRIENPSTEELLLSFNFKEEFNEYWSVSPSGIFFLQTVEDVLQQQGIQYCNLPIPANFKGFVLVPFYSFSVPEWNTARGDDVMNLKRIESFAFAVQLQNSLPSSFTIDDVEVIGKAEINDLSIQGSGEIQVPLSGEHREQYSVQVIDHTTGHSEPAQVNWSLVDPYDGQISVDSTGSLRVPSGVAGGEITLNALYSAGKYSINAMHKVKIIGQSATADAGLTNLMQTVTPIQETAYEKFSREFDLWAKEYRPLFVAISIGVILLVLAMLSRFQRGLK